MFKLNDWRRGRKKAVDFVCFSDVDSKVLSGVKLSKTFDTLFCDITNECFPLFRQNHFRNYLELCALLAKENSQLEACVRSPLQKKVTVHSSGVSIFSRFVSNPTHCRPLSPQK